MPDKAIAAEFLATLDPTAQRFSFQFFSDGADNDAQVFHGTLDAVWDKVNQLNTPARQVGVFVTINETDFKGRSRENVVRPRALFVDADGADQVRRCEELIQSTGATPSMVVHTSPGRAHFYFCCDDLPRDEFSAYQAALIEKTGTDPAVKDLPRVMRLPGTLRLKDASNPILVTLDVPGNPPRRWKLDELKAAFGISLTSKSYRETVRRGDPFPPADERIRRKFGIDCPASNEFSAGLETNIEEIRSAVAAIPPSAISAELEWVKVARGLAHQARICSHQAEELWRILDALSAQARGYDKAENESLAAVHRRGVESR